MTIDRARFLCALRKARKLYGVLYPGDIVYVVETGNTVPIKRVVPGSWYLLANGDGPYYRRDLRKLT